MTSPTATACFGAGAPFEGAPDGSTDGDPEGDPEGVADEGAEGVADGLPDDGDFDGAPGVLGEGRTAGAVMTARPLFRSKEATLSADFSARRPWRLPPGLATALWAPSPLPSSVPRTLNCGEAVEPAAAADSLPPSDVPADGDPAVEHPATSSDAAVMANTGAILVDLRKVGS
ncbi:hypothetical protein AB0C96_25550 [Streptomyces sp. NPDC048506]|uniref:hypothetical protein n=1 Tax=Streptomyces sp. NPDC048506 TaxID=3155028 RepID=UPI00344147AD